jgi:hypothetical protein
MTDFDSQKKHAPKGTEKQSDFFVMNRKSIKKGPFFPVSKSYFRF